MSEAPEARALNQSAAASLRSPDPSASFKQRFPERFSVRLHMTLLLSGVFISGLLFSKVLFELGMRSMLARYLIAVCASYAVFFLLIKIWLWYVTPSPKYEPSLPDIDIGDAVNLSQVSGDVIQGGARAVHKVVDGAISGHGGDFGGGGATDVWGDPPMFSSSMVESGSGGSSHHRGPGLPGFDLGDDAIVLIVLAALLLAIFGAGAYLVYAAPSILSEAAFQALLAAGLIKASRKMTRQGWVGSVLRATCVPFLIVLLMTGIFGWVAHRHSPNATRLADVFKNQDRQNTAR
jgi:hypothetical protein